MSILIKMGKKHATTKSTKGTATGGGKAARVDTATHSKTDLRPAGECEGTSTEKQALVSMVIGKAKHILSTCIG